MTVADACVITLAAIAVFTAGFQVGWITLLRIFKNERTVRRKHAALFPPPGEEVSNFVNDHRSKWELDARIEELTHFDPLQHDHDLCIDKKNCIGYQNAMSDLDNEKQLRILELQEMRRD